MVQFYTTVYQSLGDDDCFDENVMMVAMCQVDGVAPHPQSYHHALDNDKE